MLQAGLFVVTAKGGLGRLLIHQLAVNLNFQVGVFRFRAFQLVLRVQHVALRLRVAKFQNDGVGLDHGVDPGPQNDLLHSRGGLRRDPANVFGNQRSQPAYLA